MASSLHSFQPYLLPLSLLPDGARGTDSPIHRTHSGFTGKSPSFLRPSLRRSSTVARFGASPQLPDLDAVEELARELLGRTEGFIYTVADAAVSSSEAATQGSKQSGDWLSGITNTLETVLKILKDGLSALHVPYSYGFAIILLTVIVKAATFPLTKKQVESALAMRSLQPQVKAIQQRYAGDQERMQLETARLYKLAGVNPLAGCFPTLATIPVWIGLYRALSNVADEGLLMEGFFWIPSLSGPTTIAARQSGSGISWLFPFVDGHPPLGWSDTLAYLVLPGLLVISQYISAQIMQTSQVNDPSQQSSQVVTKLLPLLIGYFALSVPSGLSLYWLTNNLLSTAQQIWLQKLGGAKNPVRQYSDRMAKDETFNIQKSTVDMETVEVRSSTKEKAETGGLQPGERFRQIKEQEARRRKQREERMAEESAKVSRIIDNQQNPENKVAENKDEQVENMINRNSQQVLEENLEEVDIPTSNNGGLTDNAGPTWMNGQSLHGNVQKEGVAEMQTPATSPSSEPDAIDRRIEDRKRDEA